MDRKIYENGEQFVKRICSFLKIDMEQYKKKKPLVPNHEVSM